jgi:large subunit ribosomal protein L24
MEVETPTWVPSLRNAPFPSSVLDELRNKYSKYRTRHDPEYVAKKHVEDLKKEYIQKSYMTPKEQLRAQHLEREKILNSQRKNGTLKAHLSPATDAFIERYMKEHTPAPILQKLTAQPSS